MFLSKVSYWSVSFPLWVLRWLRRLDNAARSAHVELSKRDVDISPRTEIQISPHSRCAGNITCEIKRYLVRLPEAKTSGNLVVGTLNFEFLTLQKLLMFSEAYLEIINRHHLLLCAEVTEPALSRLGELTGYSAFVSQANTRSQAVGLLINPRLEILSCIECIGVSKVHSNMRPALVVNLEDRSSGRILGAAVVHLKSLRGGVTKTSPIRRKQLERLIECLGPGFTGLIGGDFNTFLDNTEDTKPLTEAGYNLVYPGDTAAAHRMGGRLDGFFVSSGVQMSRYQVRSTWRHPIIGRHFTDHSLLTAVMKIQ